MNSNVKIMVELQQHWDRVLHARASIDKIKASVKATEKDLSASRSSVESLSKKVKELKNSIKQNELSLSEMGARIAKLEDRKKIIHTEKELHALEKEIDSIRFETGKLEEKTLSLIDDLDLKEKELSRLQAEVAEQARIFEDEKAKSISDIAAHEDTIKEHNDKFDAIIDQLSALYKSKFLKMINSRDGKGIARVDGEICGFCNFKIPSFLAIDASKDDHVVNCTNCGKYIYK
ncbi:MAG TPA: hypothetical protein PL180_13335 [Spirochaetota bacterium]|nr:hypothetical protein [Spirochaetota bacterium]HPL17672.1 hypothetical protein [Spirochaetota bacterium]HQJ69449.1 hypothetical protein [Spirochaetota bacterium]HRS75549.1 hypothetical protein [Spirochaetota bacterium]HRT75959.1 hypothetical protein [Spirochaetota bacterium]